MSKCDQSIACRHYARAVLAGLTFACLIGKQLQGQTATAEADPADAGSEAPLVLSPFIVSAERDVGYQASNTLAGSRLNSALIDTPAAISVMTKQFLDDIGATDINDALEYSLNGGTDLGGDFTGNTSNSQDVVGQLRGFGDIRQARNYFETPAVALDTFNIERLDFARGPNAVLFGIGGAGGIINTTPKLAHPGQRPMEELQVRVGSYNELRVAVDVSRDVIEDKLAARVNLVTQSQDDWVEFAKRDLKGSALALTYRPFRNTYIRFDGQYLDVNQIVSQPWPAMEGYLGWFNAGRPIAQTLGSAPAGTGTINPGIYYVPLGSGAIYANPINYGGSRGSASGSQATAQPDSSWAITDTSIYPRGATLSGPGFTGDYEFFNHAFFLEQRFGSLAIELAYNHQEEHRDQHRVMLFNDRLQVDVNALLPDGSPNPYAPVDTNGDGSADQWHYFVDADDLHSIRDRRQEDFRATLSYDLDLTKRNKWLGHHTVGGLLSRTNRWNFDDTLEEHNITPESGPFPADPFYSTTNKIVRRTYVDFSSSDPALRSIANPLEHPLTGQGGVTSGYVRASGSAAANTLERVDSKMIAVQSRLLRDRMIVTAGWRNDIQNVWNDTDGVLDPMTNRFTRSTRNVESTDTEGNTQTIGGVLHITKWLAAFYNQGENFIPQGAAADLYGRTMGPLRGEGQDIGVRLRLFDNRLNLSVSRYENNALGATFRSSSNEFGNSIASIWRVILDAENSANGIGTAGVLDPEDQARDVANNAVATQTTAGEGWEMELTANPTRNWRLTMNLSQTEQISSDAGAQFFEYIGEFLPEWREHGDLVLTNPLRRAVGHLTGYTINEIIGAPAATGENFWAQASTPYPGSARRPVIFRYLTEIDQRNGLIRRGMREWTGNFFTSYTFNGTGNWMEGLRVGGGVQYRGPRVLGYNDIDHPTDPNKPILGGAFTIVNLQLGYTLRLRNRHDVRLQLNVNNLLNKDDLIVTDASDDGVTDPDGDGSTLITGRYYYQPPRSWSLTATYKF